MNKSLEPHEAVHAKNPNSTTGSQLGKWRMMGVIFAVLAVNLAIWNPSAGTHKSVLVVNAEEDWRIVGLADVRAQFSDAMTKGQLFSQYATEIREGFPGASDPPMPDAEPENKSDVIVPATPEGPITIDLGAFSTQNDNGAIPATAEQQKAYADYVESDVYIQRYGEYVIDQWLHSARFESRRYQYSHSNWFFLSFGQLTGGDTEYSSIGILGFVWIQ